MHAVTRSALIAAVRSAATDDDADARLLARFAAGDEPAFAELVRRHARLVWGVCRHALPCDADADDAFQATFLALARHAATVRNRHRLAGWLHTVAVRVCRNARRAAARRTKREARAAVPERSRPVADSAWDAAAAVVHDEVAKLPAAHRIAFVLCVLDGKTPTAAAAQLGLPVGTVGAHLHRAKERLLKRLAARGLGAGVAFATLLDTTAPASAVERAISAAHAPPAAVLNLLPGAVPMTLPHAKLVLMLAVLSAALGGLLLPTAAQDPSKVPAPQADAKAKLDLHGDPLPEKAVMRLGTVKYRVHALAGVGFKKSGELVALTERLELYTFPADGSPTPTVTPVQAAARLYGLGWVTISADARFAAAHTPVEDNKPWKVVVWDLTGEKPVEHMALDFPFVHRLAISPDGRWLVVCDENREAAVPVQLFDLGTKKGKPVAIPPNSGYVEHVSFNADGTRLAVTLNDTTRVFDTDSGELLTTAKIPNTRLDSAAVSPDGKAVAVNPGSWAFGGAAEVRLLTVPDGRPVDGWTNPKAKGRNVGFLPDGKTVWTLGGGKLREWDPAAAKWGREADVPLDQMHVPGPVWSPDGKRFAMLNEHTLAFVDAATWKPQYSESLAAGPTDAIFGIAVSPDGTTIATDGNDVHLWDAATGKLLGKVKSAWGNQTMLVFRPDSKSIITVVDRFIPAEFDARTGKELRRFTVPKELVNKVMLRNLSLSADGKTLTGFAQTASSEWKSAWVRWDLATGEVSGQAAADDMDQIMEIRGTSPSPDGEWMAGGSAVGRADKSEKPVEVFPPEERALNSTTVWSADSKRVALPRAVGKTPEERRKEDNGTLVVFDVTTQKTLIELPTGKVVRAAFSADGTRLAAMGKTAVAVWNVESGKEVFRAGCDSGTTIYRRAIAFTPDGRRLITGHGTSALVWELPK